VRRILFPVILGLGGVITLIWLGMWQLERLSWKVSILDDINARLTSEPVPLPVSPKEAADEYMAVALAGTVVGPELRVLVSGTAAGTGYRAIRAFEMLDGRRVLVDVGLLPLDETAPPPTGAVGTLTGTLIWPDDVNSSTPAPDLAKNIWFGREVEAMSAALQTEPLMVVARTLAPADPRTTLLPVDTAGIKNDHLLYAITWFGLAFVWAIMSLFLISRTLRSKDT
tara:strand:- start:378 stop:1055 length:678 start_codon:yes stop_codon:yes gene_type:complete